MMETPTTATNFDMVRAYYSSFNEWERLETSEGAIEFRRAMEVLDGRLAPGSRVLDLGGGPGRYTAELAKRGHRVVLADVSRGLLDAARQRFAPDPSLNIERFDEVNAEDLSIYSDASFDAVLAFGPFYHLTSEDERKRAANEICRVLRPEGLAFAVLIPRLSGIAGVIERAAARPEQVKQDVLQKVAETGVFHNASSSGFQEGYYAAPGEAESLFESAGFGVVDVVSLKSIAYGLGDAIARLDDSVRAEVMRLVDRFSRYPEIIATCGHFLLVLRRA